MRVIFFHENATSIRTVPCFRH